MVACGQPRISRTASAVIASVEREGICEVVVRRQVAMGQLLRRFGVARGDELDQFGVLVPARLACRQGGAVPVVGRTVPDSRDDVPRPQRFERADDEAHRRAAAVVDHDLVEIMSNRSVFRRVVDHLLALPQVGPQQRHDAAPPVGALGAQGGAGRIEPHERVRDVANGNALMLQDEAEHVRDLAGARRVHDRRRRRCRAARSPGPRSPAPAGLPGSTAGSPRNAR